MWSNLRLIVKKTNRFIAAHPRSSMFLLLIICALASISRRPEAISNAQFWAEDGRYWYADAYNEGPISSLFGLYGGYFVMTYRVVASFSLLLPLSFAPLFFNLVALIVQLLPVVLLSSSRFTHIITKKTSAYLICILYILIPNLAEVHINLTNIQWHLGITTYLILFAKKPNSKLWLLFDVLVILATGLAGPMLILLFPIAFYMFKYAKNRGLRLYTLLIGLLAILQLICIFFISDYERVGGQPDAAPYKIVRMIGGQIFSGGLAGEKNVSTLYDNELLLYIAFLIVTLSVLYCLLKGPLWLKMLNTFGILSIVSMLASLRPTPEFDTWLGLTNPGGGQRYWYIPITVWLVDLIWITFESKILRPLKYTGAILLTALLVYGIPKDWRLRGQPDLKFKDHAIVFELLPDGETYSIPVNPGWDMKLTKK